MNLENTTTVKTIDRPEDLRKHLDDPMVRQACISDAWYRGDLSYQLRPHGQVELYNFIHRTHKKDPTPELFVVETHRRFGKSYIWTLLALERALSRPWQLIKYAAPTAVQCQKIVKPNLARILRDCPADLKPHKAGMTWTFKNPRLKEGGATPTSEFHLIGVNEDPDAIRGEATDFAVLDEAGMMKRLGYIIEDILSFQFIGREDPMMAMISTPPASMDHPFIKKYIPDAMLAKRYFIMPASNNKDFSKEDEAVVIRNCQSTDSISWQREAECRHITDTESMIVPEYNKVKKDVVRKWKDPGFFYPEICFDAGAKDYCHMLFGFVDFREQTLIIKDEIWVHYKSTGQITDLLKGKQREVFPKNKFKAHIFADAPLQQLIDFQIDHGISVEPALKHDADVTLSSLRTAVQSGKIMIDPKCERLIYQLENGVWNDKRTDWVRSEELGHCDGISALAYFNRCAKWRRNPYPDGYYDPRTTFDFDQGPKDNATKQLIRNIFKR